MDDGLAELLFVAAWGEGVDGAALWRDLWDEQREMWQRAAVAARKHFAERTDAEVKMLRDANGAWQRENAELRAQLEEAHHAR